jgi:hypothetical protein
MDGARQVREEREWEREEVEARTSNVEASKKI